MSEKRTPTTQKLAEAILALKDDRLLVMVKKARSGYYDDYKTTIPAPIVQLVLDFEQYGYPEMAERARNGEWDAQPWEGKEWMKEEGMDLLLGKVIKEKSIFVK